MAKPYLVHSFCAILALWSVSLVRAEDPYKYHTWTITYGNASPLGIPQRVILINGQFPGPKLDLVTNDNVIVNVINKLEEPFLMTWNGIKQRKNSWQDGVLGTNCPIPPNSNYTYKFQAKDQIGSYTYFPSTLLHRAAGGFGGLTVWKRSKIPIPYPEPAGDFTLLIGDWFRFGHKELQQKLDSGKYLPFPDALLINGQTQSTFTGDPEKTYMFRISNVGLTTSINFRIQDHTMQLIEIEGSHVIQDNHTSLDVHVGQSMTVLVALDKTPKDYQIVATSKFNPTVLTATAVLHYSNSKLPVAGPVPEPPPDTYEWSLEQARSVKWNLTANAARPNIQGSYHYGTIPIAKKFLFANSAPIIDGKQRYAVNGVSFIHPDTPLKLADYFNITGVFDLTSTPTTPTGKAPSLGTSVIGTALHDFVEIVFQNNEKSMETWHLDGYDFWVVGFGSGQWTESSSATYNLHDAPTRHTVQVYPNSWSAILVSLDNQGMWNLRSAEWGKQYLGQQLYVRVYNPVHSFSNEYNISDNALLCGKAVGRLS